MKKQKGLVIYPVMDKKGNKKIFVRYYQDGKCVNCYVDYSEVIPKGKIYTFLEHYLLTNKIDAIAHVDKIKELKNGA